MAAKIIKIYGPPGTGKTSKLQRIVEKEVHAGTPLKRIGYLSFTKGAAEVIRQRMNATVEDVKWFRTIHSACMALMEIGRESVIVNSDFRQFTEETGMVVSAGEFSDWDLEKPLDFTPTLRALELAAATQQPLADVLRGMPPHPNLTLTTAEHFQSRWKAFKRANHKFDFTDMLLTYLESGASMPVDVLILDEGQDLSVLQWACFHRLMGSASRVYMAGDDDQAIYSFIGGSEYGFLEHPCDEEIVLPHSWRVPTLIGEEATRIIQRVSHRKQKAVEWKKDPGTVQRLNLDAFTLPWHDYVRRYKSIMVLTRHRKGARDFSDDLKAIGIPHDLNGEGMKSWPEARIAHTYYALREEQAVFVCWVRKMLDEMGLKDDVLHGLKPRAPVTRSMLPMVDWTARSIVPLFAGGSLKKIRRYEALRQLVNNDGYDILAKDPVVRVSTMHAAKGAEAELVIIVPECTGIVRQNLLTPSEIRLAYVALTRAMKQSIILVPRSDIYISHFFGG